MNNHSTTGIQVLDLLEGTWHGEGRGYFPSITAFDHRATLTFTRRDEKTLAYEQRAQSVAMGVSSGSNRIGRVASFESLKMATWN